MFLNSKPSYKYMSRLGITALAVFIFCTCLVPSARADQGIISGSVVNVRSGPGSNEVVGSILKGTQIEILDSSGSWIKIKYANLQGWVASQYISSANSISSSASPSVIFNQKAMQFEVAPRIENGRTLVPLRAIFEAMGANVDWNNSTRTVTARRANITVVLPLGSTTPTVNGQTYKLEVPAQIVNNRTLAPLRFVGEAFGGQVKWDAQNNIINITYTPAAEPTPAEPETPRVVKPTPPVETELENVLSLSKTRDASGIGVTISSKLKMEPKIKEISGCIQYEFTGRSLSGINYFEEKMGSDVLKVMTSSKDSNTLITVTLPAEIVYKMTASQDGKQLNLFIPNYITNIARTPYGSVGDRFIVSTLCPVTWTGSLGTDKLVLTLPNLSLKKGTSYNLLSHLVSSMNVENSPTGDLLITFNGINLGKYSCFTNGSSNTDLNIILMRKIDFQSREKLLVLDAGHGGRDTGARGSLIDEKVVNLAVTLKAGELLKQKGIRVEYARIDDSYVGLEERSSIANNLNAAVFLSIHCNSIAASGPCGTETYFYAPLTDPNLFVQRDERSQLATLLQAELTRNLQRTNRGVKEGNLSVLRNSQMPSALVEMAFISNASEQALLMQDDFRNLAAQSIANAVEQFMNSIAGS